MYSLFLCCVCVSVALNFSVIIANKKLIKKKKSVTHHLPCGKAQSKFLNSSGKYITKGYLVDIVLLISKRAIFFHLHKILLDNFLSNVCI